MPSEPRTDTAEDRLSARRRAYRGISLGTTFICTGVILLLNTYGLVSWGVWLDLIRLWPVFLIGIGLRLLLVPTRLHPLALLGPVIVISAATWAVMVNYDTGGPADDVWGDRPAVDLTCAAPSPGDAVRLDARFAGGDLLIRAEPPAGPEPAPGFAGAFRYEGDEPEIRCGSTGNLSIEYEDRRRRFHIVSPFGRWGNRWDASLVTSSPVDVGLDLAASTAELDLAAMNLRSLHLEAAVTSLTLRLGEPRGRVVMNVDGAMTSLTLVMPKGTCYRVNRDRALNLIGADDARGRVRGARRVVSKDCMAEDGPSYDITYDLPFSIVEIETETDGG